MDAIDLLKRDHDHVKELLQEYEAIGNAGNDEKRRLAAKIIGELMVHERIEEEVFYPAYKQAADKEGRSLVAESKEEHHVVDLIIDELQQVNVGDEDFEAKFAVLKENLLHHIKEEEEEMFPDAKIVLKGQLVELGEVMGELKASLERQIKPQEGQEQRRR